jgi:hypothetical protein
MTFTIEMEMYEGNWQPKFSFNADSEEEASSKLYRWTRYHSFSSNETRIREATDKEATYWVHNEYIDFLS